MLNLLFSLLLRGSLTQAFYFLFFGVVPFSGGGGGGKKKEAARADDLARQERDRAAAQAAQVKSDQQAAAAKLQDQQQQAANQLYGRQQTTAGNLQSQQGSAADQLRQQLLQTAAPNALETQRQGEISGMEPQYNQMLQRLLSGQGPILNTPLGQQIEGELSNRLQAPPTIPYQDTFGQQFQLLRGQVANAASQRGIVGSGLELENLGRAGIDLAVQQAQARQNNMLLNEQLRQQSMQNALTGNQSLSGIAAGQRGEFQQNLQNLQGLEEARRAREQQIGMQAGIVPASMIQTGNLGAANIMSGGNLQGSQMIGQGNLQGNQQIGLGNIQGSNVLQQGTNQALGVENTQLQNQVQERQAQDRAVGQLAGTAAGIGAAFIPGVGPMISPMVMQGVSGAFGGQQQQSFGNPYGQQPPFPTSQYPSYNYGQNSGQNAAGSPGGPATGASLRSAQQSNPYRNALGY